MESTYYTAATRLRRMTGMRGYGVYCRLVELCNATPQRKVKYDLEDFSFDMHEEPEFIRQIAEEFDLFTIEDGTIADSFTKTPEFKEKERQEQIRKNRSEGAKKAAQTRKAKKAAQAQNSSGAPQKVQTIDNHVVGAVAPQTQNWDEQFDGEFLERFNSVRSFWNETFKRKAPRRVVPESDFNISTDVITNFAKSCATYSDDDFMDAIKQASEEEFAWQFKDVLKSSNMQRLLSNFEIRMRKQTEKEEELTPEQKELMEFGNEQGWNWTNESQLPW